MPKVIPSLGDVLREAIAAVFVAALFAVGGGLVGILDAPVPLWVVLLLAVCAVGAFLAGRIVRTRENLEALYVDHLREVLDTLQMVVAGEIPEVTARDFIEQGILAPARQWLAVGKDEDVRLSILAPDPRDPRLFSMVFAAGHTLGARKQFQLPIQQSFAGFAYVSGEMKWTNDVESDSRWKRHPHAREDREYGSLASVPIKVGTQVVAVFNVLSTRKNAFLASELMYIDVLGSIINVIWSLFSVEVGQEDRGLGDLRSI